MIDLSSRGLPMRPDQNPLAGRREQMAQGGNPQMQQQMAQAEALRQDPSGVASPQSQGQMIGMAPNATMPQQAGLALDPLQIQQQQRQQAAQMRGRF
jgi:hypothetical protein